MRRILVIILLSISMVAYSKNEYTIFIMRGDVEVVVNGTTISLTQQMKIDENTELIVHPKAYLTLKSTGKKRHTITIDKPYKGKVKNIDKACKQKRSKEFMLLTKGKTASEFSSDGHFFMSGAGYNTRDMFTTEKEEEAIIELIEMLKQSGIISDDE